jgi:hypothetical protein
MNLTVLARARARGARPLRRAPKTGALTIAQHVELGNQIKAVDAGLSVVYVPFAKSHPVVRYTRQIKRTLAVLRGELDDVVCKLVPSANDPRRLATHVYYGTPLVPNDEPAMPGDAFAEWKESEIRS